MTDEYIKHYGLPPIKEKYKFSYATYKSDAIDIGHGNRRLTSEELSFLIESFRVEVKALGPYDVHTPIMKLIVPTIISLDLDERSTFLFIQKITEILPPWTARNLHWQIRFITNSAGMYFREEHGIKTFRLKLNFFPALNIREALEYCGRMSYNTICTAFKWVSFEDLLDPCLDLICEDSTPSRNKITYKRLIRYKGVEEKKKIPVGAVRKRIGRRMARLMQLAAYFSYQMAADEEFVNFIALKCMSNRNGSRRLAQQLLKIFNPQNIGVDLSAK